MASQRNTEPFTRGIWIKLGLHAAVMNFSTGDDQRLDFGKIAHTVINGDLDFVDTRLRSVKCWRGGSFDSEVIQIPLVTLMRTGSKHQRLGIRSRQYNC